MGTHPEVSPVSQAPNSGRPPTWFRPRLLTPLLLLPQSVDHAGQRREAEWGSLLGCVFPVLVHHSSKLAITKPTRLLLFGYLRATVGHNY